MRAAPAAPPEERPMGKTIRVLCWGLFFVFLAHDLNAWGGLAITPDFGARLRTEASVRSPLAATYLFAGRKATGALHRRDAAVAYAARHFRGDLFTVEGPPETLVQRTLAAQSAFGALAYYGAPLLLLLSLALHGTRQKQVRSFGRRG
jgi:hypothetical protein